MYKKKALFHIVLLISPILFAAVLMVNVFLGDYEPVNDFLIDLLDVYAVVFLFLSSFIFSKVRKTKVRSFWDVAVLNGYPVVAPTFFAGLTLFPLMERTIGMGDSPILNSFVTLILASVAFIVLVCLYEVLFKLLKKELSDSNH